MCEDDVQFNVIGYSLSYKRGIDLMGSEFFVLEKSLGFNPVLVTHSNLEKRIYLENVVLFPIDYIYDIYAGTGRLWIFNLTSYAIFDVSTGEPE
jgi:hypothetical protein